jgi:hypothetical protein
LRSRRRASGSRCRLTCCASMGSRRPRRSSSARLERTGTAIGASCRRRPTGCRLPSATFAGRATPSSGRSSSMSCGSRTASSPRSRRSALDCSPGGARSPAQQLSSGRYSCAQRAICSSAGMSAWPLRPRVRAQTPGTAAASRS